MAKGDPLTPHQQRIVNGYYENLDTATIHKLSELVSDLYVSTDAASADKLWESARRALSKTAAPSERAAGVLARKDIAGLASLVSELSKRPAGGTATPASAQVAPSPSLSAAPVTSSTSASAGPAASPEVISPETLKSAMKAFRKRLKLTRLDEESRLGRSPLTTGGKSGVVAIVPPNQFPRAVWEELVKQGQLRHNGREFYELVNP